MIDHRASAHAVTKSLKKKVVNLGSEKAKNYKNIMKCFEAKLIVISKRLNKNVF